MPARNALAALAGALLLPAPLLAQQAFEGSVAYRIEGSGMNAEMLHFVKDGNTRVEMSAEGQSMVMITDFGASKMIMLMPAQKQWIDVKAMQEQMAAMMGNMRGNAAEAAEAADPADFEIVATGRTETIAGHTCEHFVYKAEEGEVDICAAKGLGWYMGAGAQAGGGMMGGMRGMMGMGGGQERSRTVPGLSNKQLETWRRMYADGFFPLKIVYSSGRDTMTILATSVERKSLSADLFVPPSDYTEMKMPGRD